MDDGALARVEALVDLGRCSEAESMLARVLADRPDDHRAWCLLALARDGLSHWSEMLRAANHAVAVAPDHEWGHRLASIALARLEMTEEAVRAAAEAVRLDPHGWRTHLQYSLVAAPVPRLVQDAYRAAGRAAEIAPHSADAHFALGLTSDATGRHEAMAGHYREALRLNPQHVNAMNNLTNLERSTRLGAKAAGYARALRLDPSAAVPRENLELMAGQFLLHVTGLAAVALLACAVIGAADDLRPGFSVGRLAVGVLLVAAVSGYTARVVRAVPDGALRHVRSRAFRPGLRANLVLATLCLLTAVAAALAPWGASLAVAALRPLGLLAIVVGVAFSVRRRT
jgi:tetratricopeptide (TPR) repeat protein